MTAPPRDPVRAVPRLDALVCRLAGGMAMLAAAIFLTVLFAVTRLPLAAPGAGASAYAIPGTQHAIDAGIVPVLAWCGGGAALLGCAALALAALPLREARSAVVAVARPQRRSFWRPALLLAGGFVALATVMLLKR